MSQRYKIIWLAATIVCVSALAWWIWGGKSANNHETSPQRSSETKSDLRNDSVVITDQQLKQVHVESAKLHDFVSHLEAVGFVDFNQDTTVPVLPTVSGKIRQVFVRAGEDVKKGQSLYSIDSPDFSQALSTLVSTAGIRVSAGRALDRARQMLSIQAASQKDLDQATADQQTAEANYQAARDAVRIYGKSNQEIDKIITSRKPVDELIVYSPISGRVVARNASAGMLVQPGSLPAPVTVADLSTMWLIANAPESDIPKLKLNQKLKVSITALPGELFDGVITNIGASIDPNSHRIAVRSEISDAKQRLKQQMLATYIIETGQPVRSVAIPANGIVRESDGTMTVFVTTDNKTFTRRAVLVGQEQKGLVQILDGLSDGEKVAADGAIFISNAMQLQSR